MADYEFHEAANIFPLDEEHIAELAADIKKNKQQVPIELLDGKIVDGRRRYKACQLVGVKPLIRHVSAEDPVAYVLSLNLHRRHLTPSQRSMVGARAREYYDREAKERQKSHSGTAPGKGKNTSGNSTGSVGDARDLAGKSVGVGGSLIDRATKVIEKGVPELAKAVDEDRISVSSAATIADKPPEVQQQIAAEAKKTGGRYRLPKVVDVEVSEEVEVAVKKKGVGLICANEAINCLMRIPKNDPLRSRGLQLVGDWIKLHK